MKKCPACKESTVPYKWIFFGLSKNKSGRCFQCTNCGITIKKSRWLLFDYLYYSGLLHIGLFLLFFVTLFEVSQNVPFSLFGTMVLIVVFFMLIALVSPLREADESYCRDDMSKIGAIFALIAIPTVIIYTIYVLLYKPLVLGEAP